MGAVLLLLASFAVILVGAMVFTNAVEWAGHRLAMGEGSVGSLLAAVGTAMPETLIPIVAIIGGDEGSEDVAIGAIIGAPFLLATIAMALVGTSALIYRNRRAQGTELRAHAPTLERDLVFFLIFFGLGVAVGAADAAGCRAGAAGRAVRGRLRLLRPPHAAGRRRGPGRRHDRPTDARPRRRRGCRSSWTSPRRTIRRAG